MDILIIIAGGTLDKVHDTITEGLVFSKTGQSQVGKILEQGRTYHPKTTVIMQKDSLDMNDSDRVKILHAVKNAKQTRIVITHGTGTMELTAKYLAGKTNDKTVVLTGAMRPNSLGKSDAGFNLGGAIIAAQTLGAGVFAVMNGRVIESNNLHKNTQLGRFDL